MIDQIDGNRSNNAIGNLRDASRTINGQNQKRAQLNNETGVLGVTRIKKNRARPYQAHITINGKPTYIGVFSTAEEAGAAYLAAKRQHHEGCSL